MRPDDNDDLAIFGYGLLAIAATLWLLATFAWIVDPATFGWIVKSVFPH